jgi:hypothetical protein
MTERDLILMGWDWWGSPWNHLPALSEEFLLRGGYDNPDWIVGPING